MACIEIRVGNKTFKIQNDELQSDVYQASDWQLVMDFMTRGYLPAGYWIEGAASRDTLLDEIISAIDEGMSDTSLFTGFFTDKISQTDFINKMMGNGELNILLSDSEKYDASRFDKNVRVVSGWGSSKNWYGFTKDRAFVMTGNKYYQYDHKLKALYTSYLELKDNPERVTKIIDKLYNGPLEDVFSKFTWLANNDTLRLVGSLYNPSAQTVKDKDDITLTGSELHKKILDDLSSVKGKIFNYKNQQYMISSRAKGNDIESINLSNNKLENIPVKSIKVLYDQFHLQDHGKDYMLAGKNWYLQSGGNYTIVSDEEANRLFEAWFGVSPQETMESIDFYSNKNPKKLKNWNGQEPITGSNMIGDQTLIDFLPNGSIIQASSGIYVKQDGAFYSGEYELDPEERISRVSIHNNESVKNGLLSLKTVEPNYPPLSEGDLRIILSNYFNFDNFDTVSFNYKQNEFVKVTSREVNGEMVPWLQIGLGNKITSDASTFKYLKLAVDYYEYLQATDIEKLPNVANPKSFWQNLKDYIINGEDTLPEEEKEVANILGEGTDDPTNGELLNNILVENRRELSVNMGLEDDIDSFIKDMIDKGLYLSSCDV